MSRQAKRTLIGEVSMSISGSTVTESVRNMVLSENWRGAWEILESIGGCTTEIATAILKGEKRFAGSTSDEAGIRLEDDGVQNEDTERYLDTYHFQLCGFLKNSEGLWQPEWEIEALGPDDFRHACEVVGKDKNGTPEFLAARARYYFGEYSREYFVTLPKTIPTEIRVDLRGREASDERLIFWKKKEDYPLWFKPMRDPVEALDDFLAKRRLQAHGCETTIFDLKDNDLEKYEKHLLTSTDLTDAEEIEREELEERNYQRDLLQTREKIIDQAGPKGGEGWLRLPVYPVGKADLYDEHDYGHQSEVPASYVEVPRLAFMHWSMARHDAVALGLFEDWKAVCTSGWKMYNDDPYHSDWVIGAGYDPRRFYDEHKDVSDSSYALRNNLCIKMLKFEFTVLSKSTKKKVEGRVRKLNPGEELKAGEIGVIPEASMAFDVALRSAAKHGTAIICLTGGPLAHVAVVGRELDVPVIMWPQAKNVGNLSNIALDMEKYTVRIREL